MPAVVQLRLALTTFTMLQALLEQVSTGANPEAMRETLKRNGWTNIAAEPDERLLARTAEALYRMLR